MRESIAKGIKRKKTTPIYHVKHLTNFNPNRLRGPRAPSMMRVLEGKKATLNNVYSLYDD